MEACAAASGRSVPQRMRRMSGAAYEEERAVRTALAIQSWPLKGGTFPGVEERWREKVGGGR